MAGGPCANLKSAGEERDRVRERERERQSGALELQQASKQASKEDREREREWRPSREPWAILIVAGPVQSLRRHGRATGWVIPKSGHWHHRATFQRWQHQGPVVKDAMFEVVRVLGHFR